jgi:glycopeptide antibiotics resistance protein
MRKALPRIALVACALFLAVLFLLTLTNHPYSQEIHDALRPFVPVVVQDHVKFDIVLNALLLAPLGLLLPILSKGRVRFLGTVGVAAAVSGFIELSQLLVFTERQAQWRDFVLNVLSAMVGYALYLVYRTSTRRRNTTVSATASAASTSGTAMANGTDAASRGGSWPARSASSDRA